MTSQFTPETAAASFNGRPFLTEKDKKDAKKVADRLFKVAESRGFTEGGFEPVRVQRKDVEKAVKGTDLTAEKLLTGLVPSISLSRSTNANFPGFIIRRRPDAPLGIKPVRPLRRSRRPL